MYIQNENGFAKMDIPNTDSAQIVVFTPQSDTDFAVRKIVLKSGGSMPNHTNLIQHQQFVLSGEAKVLIDGQEFRAKAGFIYIPGGVSHSYEACYAKDYEFLCMIPKKADELKFL